jgi:universal stress protein A
MFTPRQILVPVDFSPSSWHALEVASALAAIHHAQVDVLHVWDLPLLAHPDEIATGSRLPPSLVESVRDHAQLQLERFLARAKAAGLSIRKAETVAGSPYPTIVEKAERENYDLIVVGTHGRTGLSRAFLGSVAERVVRHAGCPVLVARAKPEETVEAQP